MEKDYEEEKKRLKDRYQVRKKKYEVRYKAEEIKTETPAPAPPSVGEEAEEVELEEEVKEGIPQEVPVEEEVEEEIEPEVQTQTAVEEEAIEPGLTDIEGIGATRATKLEEAGIKTLADLAGAIPQVIAEIAGVSNMVASDWIKKAEEVEQYK